MKEFKPHDGYTQDKVLRKAFMKKVGSLAA
jgi:hypothetical protein